MQGPGAQPVQIITDGKVVSATEPLPVSATFSGTIGKVEQGNAGTALEAWFTRDEDARASLTNIDATLTTLDGKTPALGQAAMAASVPVVVASDQESLVVDIEGLYQNGVREGLVTLSSANGLNVNAWNRAMCWPSLFKPVPQPLPSLCL